MNPLFQLRKNEWFNRLSSTLDFPVWARVPGIRRQVKLRWLRHLSCMFKGSDEPAVVEAIRRFAKPGGLFCDIGAHIGYYSCLAAELGMTVQAFEPDPDNYECLAQTARHYEMKAFNLAVTDEIADSVPFMRDLTSGSIGSISSAKNLEHFNHYRREAIQVAAISLDKFLKETPSLIKIDVEGAEYKVLLGAKKILDECKPVIIIEIRGDDNRAQCTELLTRHGYSVEQLDSRGNYLCRPGSA